MNRGMLVMNRVIFANSTFLTYHTIVITSALIQPRRVLLKLKSSNHAVRSIILRNELQA